MTFGDLSVIIGFPQTRGEMDSGAANGMVYKPLAGAHIDDLAPLILNRDELRLRDFSAWIANLENAANQKEKEFPEKTADERRIIDKTFEIISRVTDHRISFYSIRQASPPDIWVSTTLVGYGDFPSMQIRKSRQNRFEKNV